MEILELCGPVAPERGLDTDAGRPARAGLCLRKVADRGCCDCRLHVGRRETAGRVDEPPLHRREADSATDRAEPMLTSADHRASNERRDVVGVGTLFGPGPIPPPRPTPSPLSITRPPPSPQPTPPSRRRRRGSSTRNLPGHWRYGRIGPTPRRPQCRGSSRSNCTLPAVPYTPALPNPRPR